MLKRDVVGFDKVSQRVFDMLDFSSNLNYKHKNSICVESSDETETIQLENEANKEFPMVVN